VPLVAGFRGGEFDGNLAAIIAPEEFGGRVGDGVGREGGRFVFGQLDDLDFIHLVRLYLDLAELAIVPGSEQ
jgi:hypothetical protein